MQDVLRIWKSDGSQNRMSEEAAVKNLAENAIGYAASVPVGEKRNDIRRRLRSGGVVQTPLAYFRAVC